ncbi:Tetratricopeptide repeat protein 28-like isoform X1 [Oopsacas minuta]|uniref:Tetratricopeptide repeat protein 28-like isoform X1 n=1 Tax=Oopsacas minuta TaxID=111878 RepID=A0AAV7KIX5_9METZ|nr:Tetratricopeptide repeat protein 28-like isoform X1 [Oopsacas minuta]
MSNQFKPTPTPYRHTRCGSLPSHPPDSDFSSIVERYATAIALDPNNYNNYCNRSSALLSAGRIQESIQDAKKAISLQPDHSLPYYRLGLAHKTRNNEIDAIVAFCQALSRDVNDQNYMHELCELVLSGHFGTFTEMFRTLHSMGMEQDSFILISSVGNEFINLNENKKAVVVLQSARQITTDKMKVKSTLLFSLADLYWSLNDMKNAINVLEENIQLCDRMQDKISLLRCCTSLAQCFTALKQWNRAIDTYTRQINVAITISDFRTALYGCSSIGECYTIMGQHVLAVPSHRRAIQFAQRIQDKLTEAKEHCYAGCALISAGRPQQSQYHLLEHLELARELREVDEEKRALANLTQSYFMIGEYENSLSFSKSLYTLSSQSSDQAMVTRAYAGMGKAHQAMGNFEQAIELFTEQLKVSKECPEPVPRTKALANLAFAYEASGDNSMSLKYGYDLLSMSENFGLTSLQAKAYGVLGKNYSTLGNFSEALKYYQLQLGLNYTSHNPNIHLSTLCELASCFADLGEIEQASEHFTNALSYAENEKKCSREMVCYALEHYGQFLCKNGNFKQALAQLERCLEMTAASSQSRIVRRRICRELAICYEEIGNLEQAIHFYKELFRRGREEKAKNLMLESLEKLQSIYKLLGDEAQVAIYESKRHILEIESLSMASSSPTRSVTIAELARRGNDWIQKGYLEEAVTCFEDLLDKARVEEQPLLEGVAYVGLARICQKKGEYQEAIYHLKNDVLIRRTLHDLTGEVASLERLGDLCFEGEMYEEAVSHFENQLEVARQAKTVMGEVSSLGKLGKVLVKLDRLEDALSYYSEQLTIYTNNVTIGEVKDQAECCADIGDIQLQLNNLPEALSCHTQHLALVQQVGQPQLQIRAYGAMGKVHFCLGQHDDALMCYDKKQRLCRKMESQSGEVEVYGEMAVVYISTGCWAQAVSCYRHQRDLARLMLEAVPTCVEAKRSLYIALSGLANVYFQQEIYNKALENEYKGFEVANQLGDEEWKMRANGSLADIHEKTHNFLKSIAYRETQLQLARNINNSSNIANGLLGLGRCQFYRSEFHQAAISLREALTESCNLNQQGLEGRIRYYLGLVYLHLEEMESAETTLQTAHPLIDGLVNDSLLIPVRLVELLHMQENLYLGLELSLVSLDRHLEALVAADCKKNTRFLKYIIYRYNTNPEVLKSAGFFQQPLLTYDMTKLLKRIHHTVLVYSVAYTKLHIWVLRGGLIQFKQINLTEITPTLRRLNISSLNSLSGDSFLFTDFHPGLVELITQTRDSIGISTLFCSRKIPLSPVLPFTPLSENSDSETSSVTRSSISSGSSKRSATSIDYQPSTEVLLPRLYRLLIEPIESKLPSSHTHESITLILDRELHLIPFPLLSPPDITLPTFARAYKLSFSLSLQTLLQQLSLIPHLKENLKHTRWITMHSSGERKDPLQFLHMRNVTRDLDLPEDYSVMLAQTPAPPLVVASPHFLNIDTSTNKRTWCMKPAAEKEARRIGSILKVKPIIRNKASRDKIMEILQTTNCVYFSGQVSWDTMELILIAKPHTSNLKSENQGGEQQKERGRGDGECERETGNGEESQLLENTEYSTINSEDLLISNFNQMNLFVLSGHCLTSDSELDINDVISLAHILLSAGVKCVILPLWASPDNSARTLLMSLFNGLTVGGKLVTVFQRAMEGVQGFSSFSHPLNWAGYMALGSDVTLQEFNPAPYFQQLISNPLEDVKYTMNFLKELLIEAESLIVAGCSVPNVIPQKDVEAQMGASEGWKEILLCAGFHFSNGIPPDIPNSIVYPSNDETHGLHTCLSYVTSLIEMDKYMLSYLQNLRDREILIYPLLRLLKLSIFQLTSSTCESKGDASELVTVGTEIYVWNVQDCEEILKYIGYKLKSVSSTDVQLQIPKQHLTKSYLEAIISCLHALFGPEALLPRIVFETQSTEETL